MNIVKPELCAACPDRSCVNKIVARIALGPEYKTEGCTGPALTRRDMTVTSGPITAAVSSDTYGCGKPENGTAQDPLLYVTVDGKTRSVSNLRTGEHLITPPQSPNDRD